MTTPTPPRRNDLTEISAEAISEAEDAYWHWGPLGTGPGKHDRMRAALAAVLPDDRARVAAEAREEAFNAVLAVASQLRGESATPQAGLIGWAVQQARGDCADLEVPQDIIDRAREVMDGEKEQQG